MTSFRCIAINTADAVRLRPATTDDFGHAIQRFDLDRSYPCQALPLRSPVKTGMLLLSYQTPKPKSVYGHPTAIFMCVHLRQRLRAFLISRTPFQI